MLKRDSRLSDRKLIGLAVEHIYDLMALALGTTRDGAALTLRRGVRAARSTQFKIHISKNIAMHGLSVQSVAASLGFSPRYIHALFETEGTTFSLFVREQRCSVLSTCSEVPAMPSSPSVPSPLRPASATFPISTGASARGLA
jgi:hypothetical protein